MTSEQQPTTGSDMNAFVAALFRGHGVETVVEGDWIAFPRQGVKANADIVRVNTIQGGVTVQLDVRIVITPGRTMIESTGGVGETREEAIADAQRSFVQGSFHVILAAFFSTSEDQVTRETWVIGGHEKQVFLGPVSTRGSLPEGEGAWDWLEGFKRKLQSSGLGAGTHWIRLFYTQARHKSVACEVVLDNDIWEEMQTDMAASAWPSQEEFYWVRVFLIVQGGIGVGEALATICRRQETSDEELVDAFMARGVAQLPAQKLVSLIPLACGRVMLQPLGLRLPESATVRDPEGRAVRQIRLVEEPIFVAARRYAARGSGTRDHDPG